VCIYGGYFVKEHSMAAITYKCPNCDGPLTWNGEKGKFVCDFCRGMFTEAELQALNPAEAKAETIESEYVPERSESKEDKALREAVEQGSGNTDNAAEKKPRPAMMKVYVCPSCGAQVTADDTRAATTCYYCHNPIVLSDKFNEDLTPDLIIPFKIDRKKAEEIFTNWVKQQKYVPSDFYNKKQIELLTGVYFPYWVYDCTVHSDVRAEGTKIRTWEALGFKNTETSVFDISNSGDMQINDLTRIALNKASKVLCESVMPFDKEGMKPFQQGYLQGYIAEVRDVSKENIKPDIEKEIKDFGSSKIEADIGAGYDSVDVKDLKMSVRDEKYSYALMPVWTVTYKGKDGKTYYFSINGYSGKTCGELPVDNSKLIRLFFTIFVPMFAILLMLFRFVL